MQQLSTLDTSGPIDYDNLNIVIRPRPPRRRQSGISLVPYRPYVKSLTSVREPFSFADGKDKWLTMGNKETFFKQKNTRCIGTLIDDCDISDVIRWDIEGASTRLPMMCKSWIIVDGAVVERGKPHLVQDAAIQVFTAGRNRRSILAADKRYNKVSMLTSDRRRRHSWHDVNEYHSVPYYQYSRSVRSGHEESTQCDIDNEHEKSTVESLPFVIEETVDENQVNQLEEHKAQEIVHHQLIPQNRAQVSIPTQTESQFKNQSTEIDSDLIQLFNLNLQTNENLLSSIVNPYIRNFSSDYSSQVITTISRNGIQYSNRSVSTGDDYPQWWVQLSTNIILADYITNQGEEKTKHLSLPSTRQLDQSIQTDIELEIEKSRPPSSVRSSRIHQSSSSSVTTNDNYEIIDQINDGNNSRRFLPLNDHEYQKIYSDSHLNDYQIETSSNPDSVRLHRTTSSKQSESDYSIFALSLNQQSYSTPDPFHTQDTSFPCSTNQRKTSENSSTTLLTTLFERYERTLRERQRPIAIVNNELLDIDDVLKRYRQKIQNSDRTIQNLPALSSQTKLENPLSLIRLTKTKYRRMPNLTSEEMLQCYIPSPRLYIKTSTINSPRQRQPRFDYCDLYLTDQSQSSAWIRYNEQRIDQIQKRIDLMLEIDDNDENQLILSTDSVTQRIDDIIMRKAKRRNQINYYHNRILLPHRYNFRFPYRVNQSLPLSSPRLLTRNLTRSTNSISKSVKISTDHDQIRLREPSKPISRPIVSILRHNTPNLTPRSHHLAETSHVWKNTSDGKVYILKQFSIPRYYRLYTDVSFREIYNFSRILETYLNRTTPRIYSSIIKNFAIGHQLPTITSVA